MPRRRCKDTTFYVDGAQIDVRDITYAETQEGERIDPRDIPGITTGATLRLDTISGSTTVHVDPKRLHGRAGRHAEERLDAKVAALALRNLARHPRRRESLNHSRAAAARALAGAEIEDLLETLGRWPESITTWMRLAPAQTAVRVLRSRELAVMAEKHLPEVAAMALLPHGTLTIDRGSREHSFSRELARGGRPEAKSWGERAALAAAYPDLAANLASDPHPLVRASAYRHAPRGLLAEAVREEKHPVARRAAAAAAAERIGLPLIEEGPIRGRQSKVRGGRCDLLLVDVDSTLIDGEGCRDEASIAALRDAQADGTVVVLVTGRSVDRLDTLDLGIDLAVAAGELVDLATMRSLKRMTDKGEAARELLSMLAARTPAAVGDGAVDAPMLAYVRESGGRAGALVTGQDEALAQATELVGPVGSGGVGRFTSRATRGERGATVPKVKVTPSRPSNYTSWVVSARDLESIRDAEVTPDGWKAAHGHVTLDYPIDHDSTHALEQPDGSARLEAYAKVRTADVHALAVRAVMPDGTIKLQQPSGTPLHLTLATGPSRRGGHVPPAAAGRAVKEALAEGRADMLEEPIALRTLAAPDGTPSARLSEEAEEAALASGIKDAKVAHTVLRTFGERAAAHLSEDDPQMAAINAGEMIRTGLIMLKGLPGSGKSTLAAQAVERGAVAYSLDGARKEINGSESSNRRIEDVVLVTQARIATQLSLGRVVISDATNLDERAIAHHAALARSAGVTAIQVEVPATIEQAIGRDRERWQKGGRSVGAPDGTTYDPEKARSVIGRLAERRDTNRSRLPASMTAQQLLSHLGDAS